MPGASLSGRQGNLWRCREVLPVEHTDSVVSMGEGFTSLLHARRLGDKLGLPNLYLKDEGVNLRHESVVLFLTGSGYKYIEALAAAAELG